MKKLAILFFSLVSVQLYAATTNYFWTAPYISNYIYTNIQVKLATLQQTPFTTNNPTTTSNIIADVVTVVPNFGFLSLTTSQPLELASSTFATITNYQVGSSNDFSYNLADGSLTNVNAGFFAIGWQLSFVGGNSDAFEVSVFTNNTECTLVTAEKAFQTAAALDSISGIGIISLPANCRIDLRIKNVTDGDDITIERAQMAIR